MAVQAEAQVPAVLIAVGNEVRTADTVGEQVFDQKAQYISTLSHRACEIGGELSSHNIRPIAAVPEKGQGLKGFYAVAALIPL